MRGQRAGERLPYVPMAVAAVGSALLTASLFGVQATVRQQDPPTAAVVTGTSSGSLRLLLRDQQAGFAQPVSGLLPGDVVHRYVELINAGTLRGRDLTLSLDATPAGALTADGARTRAVRASVTMCQAGRWDVRSGRCSGRAAVLLAPRPLSAFDRPLPLGVGQLEPGQVLPLQIRLTLPDQDETVVNGRLPQDTVQGRQVALTWVFRQQQARSR